MKIKLLICLIAPFIAFIPNAFSQTEDGDTADSISSNFIYEINGKRMDIRDAIYSLEGLNELNSTGFAITIKGKRFILTSSRIVSSRYIRLVKDRDGRVFKFPNNIFMVPETDVIIFGDKNIKESFPVDMHEDLSKIVSENDEVLVVGNHEGRGVIDKRWTCIDSVGPNFFTLKGFRGLSLYITSKLDSLDAERSLLGYKRSELFQNGVKSDSADLKKIDNDILENRKKRTLIEHQRREIYRLQEKYDQLFTFCSLGSPVIHLKSGKCIGYLSTSVRYKWNNIEGMGGNFYYRSGNRNESFNFGNDFFSLDFKVQRMDKLQKFLSVKYRDTIRFAEDIQESLFVYKYVLSFLRSNAQLGTSDFNFPDLSNFDSSSNSRDLYEKIFQVERDYRAAKADTPEARKNRTKTALEKILNALNSAHVRIKNSKVYPIFNKEADALILRIRGKENDLNMHKKHL